MPLVTLVVAAGPGVPQGDPGRRYELSVALTPGGQLDAEAWQAGPAPWSARRTWPGLPPQQGDMLFDPDTGCWSIRLPAPGPTSDAPLHAEIRNAGQLRPGEYVTIQEPDGGEFSYRVVAVA
ncbi:hypothetical protein [Paracraurococcus lichenis]|uniref:Uncharacterized protein n=1 Tax=Paracraurococcus lichenis TaxID=3064888 RepID=A0ABT9E7T9_9PROT|nr:hypothetical protein [Paracraurococcus sp. LOR1-02]MDO9712130.1 hypothetical protein [Paracraurococcus sp. LOR1-02]